MAVDRAIVGKALPATTVTVEAGRLRIFAKAIGETDPIYTDVEAAKAAGHPDIPAPPTFLFSIELEQPDAFADLAEAGVDLRFVLHGEQSFTYHSLAYPGDVLTATPRITDVYSKKGGALEFIVKETAVTRPDGSAVADLKAVVVVRNPGAGK
ncbi:MaoC family dehydratase N-terminal domain-containing protein [Nocardia sp. NBC_01503]|uniref:MaoC family dehydratase N-terminal domain-containing protein n=1 Tax=Nocardia sp. NBC_01503 TaxID=2975997 RepID=UPI002E7C475A|nr:MaoC family dehydratase N-terminal domain-containing protein [Nocardia sp. NBC_01503]WTL33421.1 MaoC family dehydratase N-terminal domain-containing protein [Nocardia sp. NBC_01503]